MSSLPMTEVIDDAQRTDAVNDSSTARATVLVCLPAISIEALHSVIDDLRSSFTDTNFLVASCNPPSDSVDGSGRVRLIEYPNQQTHSGWVLNASDYLTAANLALEHRPAATLLLGTEAGTLSHDALRTLCAAALQGGGDLVLPRYNIGPHEGLISAALLHPLSRALYSVDARIPLPLDVAFSPRMAARLQVAARRPAVAPGGETLLWPAAEAALASFVVHEVDAGKRMVPQPAVDDLNALLANIAGSLFADIEAKAAFWQRGRSIASQTPSGSFSSSQSVNDTQDIGEISGMAADFRNAYVNLQEIWSLVLPPQSLLALKKLSLASPESFSMPANLWARTVYDFVLAFRLRTINRSHLLGALTPLYLAWVASHLRISGDDVIRADQHIQETSSAFVAEKPYLVSRWRWPDRFNP